MNITDKYDLSMGSANFTKLENTRKQYGNAKFSIDDDSSNNNSVNNAVSAYDKNAEKKENKIPRSLFKSGLYDYGLL